MHKIGQRVGLLGPLLKSGLALMKNVFKPLAKGLLIPLGLTAAAASATDRAIHEKVLQSCTIKLIISNNEMNHIINITNPNPGGLLGVRFEVGGRVGGKITPCLKLVRIMIENWNLVRKYRSICSFGKFSF